MATKATANKRQGKFSIGPSTVAKAPVAPKRESKPHPRVRVVLTEQPRREEPQEEPAPVPIAPSNARPVSDAESHGAPFVRLINNAGVVRGVPVAVLTDRLCDGYKFIEGEPCVPRVRGNPERCDIAGTPGWYPRQRITDKPNTDGDAFLIWLQQIELDMATFGGHIARPDLQWGIATELRTHLTKLGKL